MSHRSRSRNVTRVVSLYIRPTKRDVSGHLGRSNL
jgi:hypothetical protein